MGGFDITREDPGRFKDQILSLWEQCLPGTPARRFDWLMNGNPAGPAAWLLAFRSGSRELAGTLSIVPRNLYLDGRALRAGILGDFMVQPRYRAFGPGLLLSRHAAARREALGLDLLYTVPNESSLKIMVSTGFGSDLRLGTLVKPISLSPYLKRYLPGRVAAVVASLPELALRLAFLGAYARQNSVVTQDEPVSRPFDQLWERYRARSGGQLVGDRSAAYLDWKHSRNPLGPFRNITVRRRGDDVMQGYLFFRIAGAELHIGDLLVLDQRAVFPLVRKATEIARTNGCKALYVVIDADSTLRSSLARCLFLDAKNEARVLRLPPESNDETTRWHFLACDQNQ